ncbi:hypothetical protein Taro_018576 [Colocasia esculenta]|uniref:Uncharacterized protein n=1 Tax=Colocasia esculenta TaxID=4460 RepID=A0A843URR1_COLES|nr:hypothetical protein [Colocasia esculenta]
MFSPPKHKAPPNREGPLEDSSLVCRQLSVIESSSAEANKQSHKETQGIILVRPFPHGSPMSSPQANSWDFTNQGYSPPYGQYNTQHPSWSSSLSRERRQPTSFIGQEANLLVQTPVRFY